MPGKQAQTTLLLYPLAWGSLPHLKIILAKQDWFKLSNNMPKNNNHLATCTTWKHIDMIWHHNTLLCSFPTRFLNQKVPSWERSRKHLKPRTLTGPPCLLLEKEDVAQPPIVQMKTVDFLNVPLEPANAMIYVANKQINYFWSNYQKTISCSWILHVLHPLHFIQISSSYLTTITVLWGRQPSHKARSPRTTCHSWHRMAYPSRPANVQGQQDPAVKLQVTMFSPMGNRASHRINGTATFTYIYH